jgi:hypothetical protein
MLAPGAQQIMASAASPLLRMPIVQVIGFADLSTRSLF